MHVSRRNFLRTVGIGAATTATLPWPLAGVGQALTFEPPRFGQSGGAIRLNNNENAYGPSPKTMAAIRAATAQSNRYAYPRYGALRDEIARVHRVKPEQVVMGCGSSELLRVAACAFLAPGKQLIQASPTFEAMGHCSETVGASVGSVPLNSQFAHDLDGMLARIGPSTGLVYICNPNNPTGSLTPRKDLEDFIGKLPKSCYVLMDEAYHHFVAASPMYASFIDRPIDDERVIVTRTFSKVYGLAGLRLGFGVASPAIAEKLRAFVTDGSVNGLVVQAALAAMSDAEGTSDSVGRNAEQRQKFSSQAAARKLNPIESQANFVMMDTGHRADDVIHHFEKSKILIGRHFPPMDTYVRVSLGTAAEMQAFWTVWDQLPFAKTAHA